MGRRLLQIGALAALALTGAVLAPGARTALLDTTSSPTDTSATTTTTAVATTTRAKPKPSAAKPTTGSYDIWLEYASSAGNDGVPAGTRAVLYRNGTPRARFTMPRKWKRWHVTNLPVQGRYTLTVSGTIKGRTFTNLHFNLPHPVAGVTLTYFASVCVGGC